MSMLAAPPRSGKKRTPRRHREQDNGKSHSADPIFTAPEGNDDYLCTDPGDAPQEADDGSWQQYEVYQYASEADYTADGAASRSHQRWLDTWEVVAPDQAEDAAEQDVDRGFTTSGRRRDKHRHVADESRQDTRDPDRLYGYEQQESEQPWEDRGHGSTEEFTPAVDELSAGLQAMRFADPDGADASNSPGSYWEQRHPGTETTDWAFNEYDQYHAGEPYYQHSRGASTSYSRAVDYPAVDDQCTTSDGEQDNLTESENVYTIDLAAGDITTTARALWDTGNRFGHLISPAKARALGIRTDKLDGKTIREFWPVGSKRAVKTLGSLQLHYRESGEGEYSSERFHVVESLVEGDRYDVIICPKKSKGCRIVGATISWKKRIDEDEREQQER